MAKLTGKPEQTGAVDVNPATGVLLITIVSTTVWEQLASEMVNVTSLVPDESYNTPFVFSDEETAGVAFCPKSHAYDQLLPELPVLVKLTGALVHCGAVELKVAVGVW